MTSLSSSVANFRDSAFYEFGDTVFWEGQVYILNAVATSTPPYLPGVPPYPGDGIWFNPAGSVVPPAIPPGEFTSFQQTGANWDELQNYGTVSFTWSGGLPNKGLSLLINGSPIASPLGYYIDDDTNSGTIYGIGPGAPGTTINVNIVADAVSGSDTTSPTVAMTTLGKPVAPSIELVDFSINPDTGKGEVSITFQTNAGLFDVPTNINGYAIGSTNTSGVPNFKFDYDIALGTATFSELTGINNIVPPISFKIFIEGKNSAGAGPISNIIERNFNPNPPLPDDLDNLAIVTFLLGGADYSAAGNWSINTSGNQQISSYNCNTGAFTTEPTAGATVTYLTAAQERGVSVLLSLGGATWNVANGLSNGTNLARNIAFAFFGSGTSPDGWVRYGSSLTPSSPFTFDGLDLDWEGAGTADGTQEINFVTQFRALCPGVILSMAPQPPYNANAAAFPSAFTANGQYSPFPAATSPVGEFVPNNPARPALFDVNNLGFFDYVFVQYYNNPSWAPGAVNFGPNVAQFAKMVQSAIPKRDVNGPALLNTRFVLGLACADSTTPLYNGEDQNRFIQEALVQARLLIGAPTPQNWCAGSGFWNSPTANYPDATNASNPFNQLYNTVSGVEQLLDTQIIMMYCNANGVNPQWQTLPLLDFEEPGIPDIPPLAFTLSTTVPPSNMSSLTLTLTAPPADLIGLQVDVAQVGAAGAQSTAYLRPIPTQTESGNVYTFVYGLQNSWFYDLRVKGLFPNGTSEPARQTAQFNSASPGGFYNLNFDGRGQIPAVPGTIRIRLTAATQSSGGIVPNNDTGIISCWLATTTPVVTGGIFTNAVLLDPANITAVGPWVFRTSDNYYREIRLSPVVGTDFPANGTQCWISLGFAQPGLRGSVQQTMVSVTVGA